MTVHPLPLVPLQPLWPPLPALCSVHTTLHPGLETKTVASQPSPPGLPIGLQRLRQVVQLVVDAGPSEAQPTLLPPCEHQERQAWRGAQTPTSNLMSFFLRSPSGGSTSLPPRKPAASTAHPHKFRQLQWRSQGFRSGHHRALTTAERADPRTLGLMPEPLQPHGSSGSARQPRASFTLAGGKFSIAPITLQILQHLNYGPGPGPQAPTVPPLPFSPVSSAPTKLYLQPPPPGPCEHPVHLPRLQWGQRQPPPQLSHPVSGTGPQCCPDTDHRREGCGDQGKGQEGVVQPAEHGAGQAQDPKGVHQRPSADPASKKRPRAHS